MRTRNNPNAHNELLNFEKYVDNKEKLMEKLKNKKKPIFLEIGMGKGRFIIESAHLNPQNLYIGVELSKTVLSLALKKISKFEQENNTNLENLYVMSFDAATLLEYFSEKSVDKIFLNFSDPWPKKKHAKRRLTSDSFLCLYKNILKKEAKLEFKTDNRKLFEYSIASLNNFGFVFEQIYLDLHKEIIENIMTEYEEKFCDKGPIYMLVAKNEKN